MICLDPNAVITMFNNEASRVEASLAAALARGDAVAVSSVVLFELWYGAAKSERRERKNNQRSAVSAIVKKVANQYVCRLSKWQQESFVF